MKYTNGLEVRGVREKGLKEELKSIQKVIAENEQYEIEKRR